MSVSKFFGDYSGKNLLLTFINLAGYNNLIDAIAATTVFAHPDTVSQTIMVNNKPNGVFKIIRGGLGQRGTYGPTGIVHQHMYDDNKGPTDAFIWAHKIQRGQYEDIQFNHIWDCSQDVDAYTNLANICVTPSFLAKLTDTDKYVCDCLRYRSYDLYRWFPHGKTVPIKPNGYGNINWAATLPVVNNLEKVYRTAMRSKRKDRTTASCRDIGWLFSNFLPDNNI